MRMKPCIKLLDGPAAGAIFQLSEPKLTAVEMARELAMYGPVNHPVLASSGNKALEAWLRWANG